jgi:hypothetical protein
MISSDISRSCQAVVVGHDHGLDWCCPYERTVAVFCTAHGGYGGWAKGARIIRVTEDPSTIVSWIRMENGTRHSDVTLMSS